MKRFFPLFIAFSFLSLCLVWAQPPVNYYSTVNGLQKQMLKEQLGKILKNHTIRSYSDLNTDYRDVYVVKGTVEQVYDLFCPDVYTYTAGGWNREHVIPNSYWGHVQNAAYSDLFSVIPSDVTANSYKSNYPLGTVAGSTVYSNDNMKVGKPVSGQGGGHTYVFEPCDKYKGDFARIYLYEATCYDDIDWVSSVAQNTFTKESYPTLSPWLMELLLKWNNQDPVSEDEVRINNAVYHIQGNRNPFVDYPVLADYIWGNYTDSIFYLDKAVLYQNLGDTTLLRPDTTIVDTGIVNPPTPSKYDYEWIRILSDSELIAGMQVVMTYAARGCVGANMSNTVYIPSTSATFTDDFQYISALPDDALVLTLEASGNSWKLKNASGSYLGATSAKKLSWTAASNIWDISINEGDAVITNSVSKYGYIQYNVSAPRFLNYTSAQMPIQLFRKVQLQEQGDANGDGVVNVGDLTLMIGYIMDESLDNTSPLFQLIDMNADGILNVGDVTLLVAKIMAE